MNISFMHTRQQIERKTKDVTRREKWLKLVQGQLLIGVHKSQGLKPGEHPIELCRIQAAKVRRERLRHMTNDLKYGEEECIREGFPEMTPAQFVEMFCDHMHVLPETEITRIEFTYKANIVSSDGQKLLGETYLALPQIGNIYRNWVRSGPSPGFKAEDMLTEEQIKNLGINKKTSIIAIT